ncbi:MAG: tryptophan--tRNA ligase [Candidatus Dormibacteraeota bacterium]|nr:tryptophan--tRNA ligase [Candidatus Dormibacteraeota bacterium]
MAARSRPRVLSGIQPDHGLHIGNYLGALRNWVRDQDEFENYFCIVDLHALTQQPPPDQLRANTLELAAMYLASGLDSKRCEIFVQSHVAAHSQLGWIFECLTPMGWLERMTQFKARSEAQGRERVGTGVFTYPVLQAADITLYDAAYVPVGEDQRQHIELTRDLVQRINSRYGEILTVPEPLIRGVGARVMGLDSPEEKMSKSIAVERPGHAVLMLDAPDVIRRKVRRAQTDTEPAVHEPVGAGVANLLEIYAALHDVDVKRALAEFEGKPYGPLKDAVADAIIEVMTPVQQRYAELRADDAELRRLLDASAQRVSAVANATLDRVQHAVGAR